MKFRYLKHTADYKIRVYGQDYLEVINNSLDALKKFMLPKIKSDSLEVKQKIKVQSFDVPILFVDFLNKVLNYIYAKNIFFIEFEGSIINKPPKIILQGYLKGYSFISLVKEIKAVTYHQCLFVKKNNRYIFEFIIDI